MSPSPQKLLTILLLATSILAAALRTLPPRPLPADAPAQPFSAGRAFETIQAITTSAPRLVGSPAFESAKAAVLAQPGVPGAAAPGCPARLADIPIIYATGVPC